MPALAAPPRYSSCLASMLPLSRSGTTRMSAAPATVGDDALGARGGGRDGVVERERPVDDGAFDLAAVGHLAQRRRVQRGGHVRVDGLDRREDGDPRPRDAERVREVDRVAHDVGLVLQRRRDVDRGVGDDERARIGRRLHQEAVAHAASGAQRAADHGAHQLVGVQAALHQRVDLALERELDGARGRGMAVRHVLDRRGRRSSARHSCATAWRRARGPISTGSISPAAWASSAADRLTASHG